MRIIAAMLSLAGSVPAAQDCTDGAAKWVLEFAAEGNPGSQSLLGKICETKDDYVTAVVWYRKAADQGWPTAQWILGKRYEVGRGVQQDYVFAYMWLNLAGAGGVHRRGNRSKYGRR